MAEINEEIRANIEQSFAEEFIALPTPESGEDAVVEVQIPIQIDSANPHNVMQTT